MSSFAGQTVTLKFTGTEDSSLQTSFVLDDLAVTHQLIRWSREAGRPFAVAPPSRVQSRKDASIGSR